MTGPPRHRSGRRPRPGLLAWLVAIVVGGCGPGTIDNTYGRSRGPSINGTQALAELIRTRGHATRAAVRYNETLADWAQVVVRFAPAPGPPDAAEAEWLDGWLREGPGRKAIYVPHDFDADAEFWDRMLKAAPGDAAEVDRKRVEAHRDRSEPASDERPQRAKHPASAARWFGTEPAPPGGPEAGPVARTLAGPWADGVDAAAAALPIREAIRADNDETVLLSGDGRKLAVTWTIGGEPGEDEAGGVLVVANGSFLLNAALLNPARRPLAARVVDWIGAGPARVAFVEGDTALGDADAAPTSPFHLLAVEPFGWIAAHLAVFGVLLCLSLAATLGRPSPEPAGAIERPSAHPVALGSLLARTRREGLAHELDAAYRRWRHPAAPASPDDPPPSPSRQVPPA